MARGGFLRAYVPFVLASLLSAAVIGAVGYIPTIRLAGKEAVWSMVVGCVVSWVAGAVGAIPMASALSARSSNTPMAILGSTALRFIVVLILVAPLTLSGWFDRNVLVVWVVISYLVTLCVDTLLAVRAMKRVC